MHASRADHDTGMCANAIFAGKANKQNTERQNIYIYACKHRETEYVCMHVYIQRVHTYKYVYVRRHIEIAYTWLLLGKSAFYCKYFQIAFKPAIEQGAW